MIKEISKTLTWDVQEKEIAIAGTDTLFTGYKGLVRDDNAGQLAVVKQSYSPFTNAEFVETMETLARTTGMTLEGYNDFKDGRRVLGFLKNTDDNFKIGGYDCKNYMLLGNSHDGSSAIFFGTSDTMIRCTNQWSKVIATIKVRHSKNKDKKIMEILANIENYFAEKTLYYQNLERFGDIKIDNTLITKLVNMLLDVEDRTDISTTKANQIAKLEASIEEETADLGQNMFGLFNGVTHYSTHKVNPRGGNTFGNVFGKQGDLNNEAFNFGMSLIENRNTLVLV